MKNTYLLVLVVVGLIINTSSFAQYQTTPVPCPSPYWVSTCTVSTTTGWAAHIETMSGTVVNYGDLLPNTLYNIVVEVLPTVPNCATLVVLMDGDGFTDIYGTPFTPGSLYGGKDVTSSDYPGRPYKVKFGIKTMSGLDFTDELYFKVRLECAGNQPYDPYSATRVKSQAKLFVRPE